MSPEALELAAGMRTMVGIVVAATVGLHISLIGFHWFKLGSAQVR